MRTKEHLVAEIRDLMKALAENGMNMRRMQRRDDVNSTISLLMARMEIYKSICHRQGLVIEVLKVEIEYTDRKVA